MNIAKRGPGIENTTILLNFRLFPNVSPNAGFDSKSIKKAPVLLHGYVTSLIWSIRPLETAIAQTERKQAEPNALEKQTLDPILLHAAEEEQCSFFQGIQTVCQTDKRCQAVDSSSEIRSPTGQDHTSDPAGFPKHVESLRGSWTRSSRWLRFRRRPCTDQAGSWLQPKRKGQNCLPEQRKTLLPEASVRRR